MSLMALLDSPEAKSAETTAAGVAAVLAVVVLMAFVVVGMKKSKNSISKDRIPYLANFYSNRHATIDEQTVQALLQSSENVERLAAAKEAEDVPPV